VKIESNMFYKCQDCGLMFQGEEGSDYCPDCMSDDIDIPTDEDVEKFLLDNGLL